MRWGDHWGSLWLDFSGLIWDDCIELGRGRDWRGGDGHTIFMVPSQELEQKVSLATRFQWTAKTSRLCSCHDCTGNWSRLMSKSLMEPSPAATRHWFSCDSDQARS